MNEPRQSGCGCHVKQSLCILSQPLLTLLALPKMVSFILYVVFPSLLAFYIYYYFLRQGLFA